MPYRAWSFAVHTYDWDLLETCVAEALARAGDYGINTFEIHDYTIGRRGLVDAAVEYQHLPRLRQKEVLTHGKETCSRSQRRADYERLRRLCRRVKEKGLKLNFWYHVLRDAPAELFAEYPEIRDLDGGFFWQYLDGLFREFFERVPEVDRVTVTSLHETPSILKATASLSREERLLRLYTTLHEACRRAGKELIIRDFIVRHEDFQSFWNILQRLPDEIYIMTKEVLADWTHTWMPVNPFLWRYAGRKLIVEFDLYGEYWGRLDVPACYPEYIHHQIRTIHAFGPWGATGRVVHDDHRSYVFDTIFDSPNDINCYAFGRLISRPLPWLGPGMFTDPREEPGRWGWDLDAFDRKIWMDWARNRYGPPAAIPVVRALARTDEIMSFVIDIGGRGFQAHSLVPGVRSVSFLWEPFVDRAQSLGMDFLRDEKRQAYQMVEQCLEDIRSARNALAKKDYEQLVALFQGELLIIRGYLEVLEGYHQVYLAQKNRSQAALAKAGRGLRGLASEVAKLRSETFFGGLPDTLREVADFVEAGKAPAKTVGS